MRPKLIPLALLLLVAGLFLSRWGQGPGQLRPNDTVTPHLNSPMQWTSGQPGQLAVRLYAKSAADAGWRALSLEAVPYSANPVADVSFSASDRSLGHVAPRKLRS